VGADGSWTVKWTGDVPGWIRWAWSGGQLEGGAKLQGEPVEVVRLVRMLSVASGRERFVDLNDPQAAMMLALDVLARAGRTR
jgi:hypothetical protein